MNFTPEPDFIGNMPKQYRETARILRRLLDKPQSDEDRTQLNSMLIEAQTLCALTKRYYDWSYRPPNAYSMAQTRSKPTPNFDNDFERKMIRAILSGGDTLEAFGL